MKLKTLLAGVLAGALAVSAVAQDAEAPAAEQEANRPAWIPSMELSIDHTSRYLSEGSVSNPDPVNTISLTAAWELTENVSVHIGAVAIIDDTNACGRKHNVEEWDWSVGATFTTPDLGALRKLEINVDYIYYNYPGQKHTHDTDTKEYEVDITAVDLPLSPGMAFVHDFENDSIKFGVNATYEKKLEKISDKLTFSLPLELWTGNHQFTGCTSHTAFYSVCAKPTLTYEIAEDISVGAYVQMGWGLDGSVRRDWRDGRDSSRFNCCYGLNLTAGF